MNASEIFGVPAKTDTENPVEDEKEKEEFSGVVD